MMHLLKHLHGRLHGMVMFYLLIQQLVFLNLEQDVIQLQVWLELIFFLTQLLLVNVTTTNLLYLMQLQDILLKLELK